jgi:hypothetical protein
VPHLRGAPPPPHVAGAGQPHEPPQPSLLSPQSIPLQWGTQAPHLFLTPPPPQVSGAVQPQAPPQPSSLGPQSTPLQLGVQLHLFLAPAPPQVWGGVQAQLPPQPSLPAPQSVPLQLGLQVPHLPATPPPPQVAGPVQLHVPPQPSLPGPQSVPLQAGMHFGGSTQLSLGPQTLPPGQQRAPHAFFGAEQRQVLPSQVQAPGPQALPHAPQLATSDEVSTHPAPQRSGVGATQRRVQAPLTQVCPAAHTLPVPPHLPQWASSVDRFTQRPPQLLCPSGQHIPPPQVPPPGQAPSRSVQVQLEAAVQARHAPLHAVAQQWPPTQALEAQSLLLRQAPPRACLMGGEQSPSMHTLAPQDWLLDWQAPAAVQVLATRRLSAVQSPAPQTVPDFSRTQAPLPSQPFEQASSRQAPEGSAPPRGTFEQVPSFPGTAHDVQVPLQGPSQQRPWAQMLLSQSEARLQTAPLARLPQSPATHTPGDTHCESLPQLSAQWLPSQPRKGAQLRSLGTLHLPPLQRAAGVSVFDSPSQAAGRQTVSSG